MTRVLLTGFGPFGEVIANPTEAIVRALDGARVDSSAGARTIEALALPTSFERARRLVAGRRGEGSYDAIVMLGVAETSAAFHVESVGRNEDRARIPDVDGARPVRRIDDGAPDTLPVTIDVDALVDALAREGVPVERSDSAGAYVCNHVLFTTLLHLQRRGVPTRAGFLHVPPCPRTHVVARPHAIALDAQIAAVRACLRVA